MKKYCLLLAVTALSLVAMAQKAVISFDEKSHDFGKLNEDGGKVTHVFQFSNKGNAPLVIKQVQSSCGCTTPVWTKEPIEPGKKGSITVTYSPLGRPYPFTKPVTVYSNATDEQVVLTIKGEVIASQATQNSSYPYTLGNFQANVKVVQMNNIEKGKVQSRTINILNTTKNSVKPIVDNLPVYISYSVSPETLKPNEDGKITFTFNSKNCPEWGPVSDDVFLNFNGSRRNSEENKITIIGNVVEDFGRMTFDQRRKAPIVEIPVRTLNLGVVKKGAKRAGKFRINNKGIGALEIRRIINNDKSLAVKSSKMSIGSGHSADIIVQLNSKNLSEGEYKKSFTIQTNDPDNSFLILVLDWKIQ